MAGGDVGQEAGPMRGRWIPRMEIAEIGCYYTPPFHADKLALLYGRDTFGLADNPAMADRHP